jgi:hypothetical protein
MGRIARLGGVRKTTQGMGKITQRRVGRYFRKQMLNKADWFLMQIGKKIASRPMCWIPIPVSSWPEGLRS